MLLQYSENNFTNILTILWIQKLYSFIKILVSKNNEKFKNIPKIVFITLNSVTRDY